MIIQQYDLTDINGEIYPCIAEYPKNAKKSINFIVDKKYDEALNLIDKTKLSCKELKDKAVANNDEKTANISFLLDEYLNLLKAIAIFWRLCDSLDYQDAWRSLQDGIYCLRTLRRFMKDDKQFLVSKITAYLENIEKIYPYVYFMSIECLSKSKTCSICNKSPFSSECNHIAGNLYMGEMAIIECRDIEHVGFSLVKNPMDKRCIVCMNCDKENIEDTPFKNIHSLMKIVETPFNFFELERTTRRLPRQYYTSWSENSLCPCGSEKLFKECCYHKEYVENPHYEVSSLRQLRFS